MVCSRILIRSLSMNFYRMVALLAFTSTIGAHAGFLSPVQLLSRSIEVIVNLENSDADVISHSCGTFDLNSVNKILFEESTPPEVMPKTFPDDLEIVAGDVKVKLYGPQASWQYEMARLSSVRACGLPVFGAFFVSCKDSEKSSDPAGVNLISTSRELIENIIDRQFPSGQTDIIDFYSKKEVQVVRYVKIKPSGKNILIDISAEKNSCLVTGSAVGKILTSKCT